MTRPITIIGGNIAGLSAAYHLARNGCPVTVYEAKIWDKPCGGAISLEFAYFLKKKLGLDLPAGNRPVPRVRFCFSSQRYVETDGLFVILSRAELQRQLIERLEKEPGISVHFKRISSKDRACLSEQTVLATGFSGYTRKIIGNEWQRREHALALKFTGRLPAESNNPHMMFFDSRLRGYGWVFYYGNRFNVGIGGLIEKKIIIKKSKEFISRLNDGFDTGIHPNSSPNLWKIPIILNTRQAPVSFYHQGIEFIGTGDVLGIAHPVIAAGIEPAWQSGWLLGKSYDRDNRTINVEKYRHLMEKNLRLTSRKPFDIFISRMLRIRSIPFKDPLSYIMMKLFHKKIIRQIKQYPWFAMVHDGNKKTGFSTEMP